MKIYGKERPIDENASFSDMERVCHGFFKTKHGKRESYSVHRGFLIVRATTEICRVPTRMTSVFMFLPQGHDDNGNPDLFCVSGCVTLRNIAQAKQYIDGLLEHGNYSYGWQREVVSQ